MYAATVPVFLCVVSLGMWGVKRIRDAGAVSGLALGIIGASLFGYLFLMTVRQGLFASNEFIMLRDSLRYDQQNARLQFSMGLIYDFGKKYDLAEKHVQEAVRLDPHLFRNRLELARIHFAQGRVRESLKECEEIIPTNPFEAEMLERQRQEAYQALAAQQESQPQGC